MSDRLIVLDTETTGISPQSGHRIIEIGAVELVNRRFTGNTFHHYLQPDREIDIGAMKVHGITNEYLVGKPRFPEVVSDFKEFVEGAELIIHNAPFDVGFINHELTLMSDAWQDIHDYCLVTDTLVMAREKHRGQKNNLDALCKRYGIDNTSRTLHGALLDAQILADVYLAMTGGQTALSLQEAPQAETPQQAVVHTEKQHAIKVQAATSADIEAHEACLQQIEATGTTPLWRKLTVSEESVQ